MNKSVANDCQKIIINVSRRTSMARQGDSREEPDMIVDASSHLEHFMSYALMARGTFSHRRRHRPIDNRELQESDGNVSIIPNND